MRYNKGFSSAALIGIVVIVVAVAGIAYFFSKTSDKPANDTIIVNMDDNLPMGNNPTGASNDSAKKEALSTALPFGVGAQAGWPPVIQTSASGYVCNTARSEMSDTIEKTIKGKKYCVTIFSEGAAGSTYSTYTYVTKSGNGTKTTSFTLRYSSCGGYGSPGDAQYDQCQTSQTTFKANLDNIVDSLM